MIGYPRCRVLIGWISSLSPPSLLWKNFTGTLFTGKFSPSKSIFWPGPSEKKRSWWWVLEIWEFWVWVSEFLWFLGLKGFWTNHAYRVFPFYDQNETNTIQWDIYWTQNNISKWIVQQWFNKWIEKIIDDSVIFQIHIKHIFRNQSFNLVLFDSLGVRFWKITVNCEDLWTAYLRKYFYLNYFRKFSSD